jgi:hypothetical protein
MKIAQSPKTDTDQPKRKTRASRIRKSSRIRPSTARA